MSRTVWQRALRRALPFFLSNKIEQKGLFSGTRSYPSAVFRKDPQMAKNMLTILADSKSSPSQLVPNTFKSAAAILQENNPEYNFYYTSFEIERDGGLERLKISKDFEESQEYYDPSKPSFVLVGAGGIVTDYRSEDKEGDKVEASHVFLLYRDCENNVTLFDVNGEHYLDSISTYKEAVNIIKSAFVEKDGEFRANKIRVTEATKICGFATLEILARAIKSDNPHEVLLTAKLPNDREAVRMMPVFNETIGNTIKNPSAAKLSEEMYENLGRIVE